MILYQPFVSLFCSGCVGSTGGVGSTDRDAVSCHILLACINKFIPDLNTFFVVPPEAEDFVDLFLFALESLHEVHAIFYHLFLGQLSVESLVFCFI
jgi:hypothetical protein